MTLKIVTWRNKSINFSFDLCQMPIVLYNLRTELITEIQIRTTVIISDARFVHSVPGVIVHAIYQIPENV